MRVYPARAALLAATAAAAVISAVPAKAADSEARLNALARQIQALQAELRNLKRDMAEHQREVHEVQAQAAHAQATADQHAVLQGMPQIPPGYALVPAAPGSTPGSVQLADIDEIIPKLKQGSFEVGGGVRVTLGGFIEAAGIFRSRNEVADITSNFNTGIPLPNSALYHENEFRLTERQSRFSIMAQGNPDPVTQLTAYFEGDLLGAAPTANSNESNSYTPRVRHAFAVYERSDLGLYFLGGQTWSLLTMQKNGIGWSASGANTPLTVDAQYVPGFTWTRQPQFRVAKSFADGMFWLAASLENPQTSYYGTPPATLGTVNTVNPGGSGFSSGTNYSDEVAPDGIVKIAADPGWGHYEAYGLARFEHDRVSVLGDGTSHTVTAGGGGAAVLLPIIPHLLDVQGSFLAGRGIGRYGSAQLPDSVVGADGKPDPLPEVEALAGVIVHPTPVVDIYGYVGTEQVGRRYYEADIKGKETAFGYGNPLYNNSMCDTELATTDCVGNTSGITQGTVGAWWKFEKGPFGTMQVGPQYSYTHRTIYQGIGPTPKTDDNMIFLSFRYYPFS
jgi:Tfp pilus assembly protein PilN